MNHAIAERPSYISLKRACQVLDLNRSSIYARQKPKISSGNGRCRKESAQPRALSEDERDNVVSLLNSETFRDQPPVQVYNQLLDQGTYLCSVSTMHRLLRDNECNGDRRNQRPAQHHAVPRLKATGPNQVHTWDITKLPTRQRANYLSLYVVMDLYSRYVVAWMVSRKENSALSTQLMQEAAVRYGIQPGQLTIHQDRGSPMIAHRYLGAMDDLGITCSHSRPRVSNDNPMSESQFKTLKQQPDYPGRFDSYEHARVWCEAYFNWYNFEHHHSNLAGFTPIQVFTGEYECVAKERQKALDAQYQKHPKRFVKAPPLVKLPPKVVEINPVPPEEANSDETPRVNFPTISAAGRKVS